ncbi:hypothetical protein DXG03_008910 [Asterophora parasitica]|uniref:DNA replication regulator SLD2 n=1 Tax=Asterophora parasitica TaxID=117018 RepID=A0A9P7GI81_9AGAR|nr:hypothetical protein DXG03_008910 [Asterophora parasitica]
MDVSSVKAEIKAWERSFKASNGRDATIQDIKLQPEIAEKYKLYKKLSKAANNSGPSTSAHASSEPPSTPPRSRSRSHQPIPSLLIQPRAIETTAPLVSFNPFSPQKNKGKERESATKSRSKAISSPFKLKAPAVDPFPILNLTKPSAFTSTPPKSPPAATSALSRARKRLRGEPVSPSPNKGKRRRIGSQTTLSFNKVAPDSSSSEEEGEHDAHSLLISDSPAKVPAGAKSFKLLFDESMKAKGAALTNGKTSSAQTNSTASHGLFGVTSSAGDDEHWVLNPIKPRVEKGKQKAVPFKTSVAPAATGLVPVPHGRVTAERRESRQVTKRALSDTEDMETLDTPGAPSAGPSLLPPSPPPPDSRSKQFTRGKGKAVPSGRKKAKTTGADNADEAEEEDDDWDASKTNIRIVDRAQIRAQSTTSRGGQYDLDLDPDQVLGYSRRGAPRGDDTLLAPDVELQGKFDVDLPDKLRRVLALESIESKTRDSREERVVQGLVFGRRTAHYDPDKGGEIWDVGEDDVRQDGEQETRGDTEGEDDWEGEPVPWEVGEL